MLVAVTEWVRASVDSAADGPGAVLVADQGGDLIGLVSVSERQHFAGDVDAYIGELAVAATQEGRGVGKALLNAAEQWARRHGYVRITLDTGARNHRARGFYAARGYVEEDVRLTKPLADPS